MALDKTYGYHAKPQSPDCCALTGPLFDPGAYALYYNQFESIGAMATDQCTSEPESIFDSLTTWSSGNTAIATVTTGKVTGVSAGFTTANASGKILECSGNTEYFQEIDLSAPVVVLEATITIQSSGTIPTANTARGEYYDAVGSYSLGNFVDSGGYCTIGYQATGTLDPSSYTGTVTLVRTKGGVDYDGPTGQAVLVSYPSGTDDTSQAAFEVTTPTNGVVYDLDAPGVDPTQGQIWRQRMNFFENAQLPDGTYIANEVGFYVRLSCVWGSSGNIFGTDVSGDNVLGMGSTNTSWNLGQ